MIDSPPILSPRLRLASLSPEFIEALFAGDRDGADASLGAPVPDEWPEEIEHMLRLRLAQMRADPAEQPWLARALILREDDRTVVGSIGFHGGPDGRGVVEIGYMVLAAYRRQGFAEEAVLALLDWARREHGVTLFRASVSPTNTPSLSLVGKLGFEQTGVQWDDVDGEE